MTARAGPLSITLAAFIAVGSTTAIAAPDCTCRYQGKDIPEGQTICASLPNGPVLMQCSRVLNNTAWKTIQDGCPQAESSYEKTEIKS